MSRKTEDRMMRMETVVSKTCNKCGNAIPVGWWNGREMDDIVLWFRPGYRSPFGDTNRYVIDFCEPCFDWLLRQLKIDPVIDEPGDPHEEDE